MSNERIISVNPAKATLGASNREMLERIARGCRASAPRLEGDGMKALVDFIFGINKNVSSVWSGKLIAIRCIVGAMLLASALISGIDFQYFTFSNVQLVVGVMILAGFFDRMAAITGVAFYILFFIWDSPVMMATDGVQVASTLLHSPDALFAMLLVFCAIIGPGRYSIDQLIRRSIINGTKRRKEAKTASRKAKEAEIRLSYKAYIFNDNV